jgi:hypothetical protein
MASWNEIERVRKNPKTFKPLAAHLLNLPDGNWWEYAERFLRDVSSYPHPELNTRQAEFLLKLRDDKATHFKIGDGFSVATLIEKCFQARFDLEDDRDIEFIESLHKFGRRFVTGRQLGWFTRICKQLGEIEGYIDAIQ